MSLRGLARDLGMSHAWLSNLERGLMAEPKSEDLTAIAVLLGDDPAEYLRLAGRVSLAAAHLVPTKEDVPAWAARLEAKVNAQAKEIDDLRALLDKVWAGVGFQSDRMGSLLQTLGVPEPEVSPSSPASADTNGDPPPAKVRP